MKDERMKNVTAWFWFLFLVVLAVAFVGGMIALAVLFLHLTILTAVPFMQLYWACAAVFFVLCLLTAMFWTIGSGFLSQVINVSKKKMTMEIYREIKNSLDKVSKAE
jgi:hypothetical protein